MRKLRFEDLDFNDYNGKTLPDYFEYENQDLDLVKFYNEDANQLHGSSMTKVIDVFHGEKLVGYFAYLPTSLNFAQIRIEDKTARLTHPALKLGRLLVCKSMRGNGVGSHIITKIASIALEARKIMPVRLITADVLPQSIGFYKKVGFVDAQVKPRSDGIKLMYIDIDKIA